MALSDFRDFVPCGAHPRLGDVSFKDYNVRSWVDFGMRTAFVRQLLTGWQKLYEEPFRGITADGIIEDGLYRLRDEGAPVESMKCAAEKVVWAAQAAGVSQKLEYSIDANEWRRWMNPEFYFVECGLRLEEEDPSIKEAMMGLIKASLSDEGMAKVVSCMRINGFLGDLVGASHLMNEGSYNIILFARPSLTEPWGWSLWGHHLTVCVFVVGQQMVISPCFFGCEPNTIDVGPYAGVETFAEEMNLATALMTTLTAEERQRCILYDELDHPNMPDGFPHPADGRNLAGAYEDNRIMPYTGGRVSEFSRCAQDALFALIAKFLDFIPAKPRAAKLEDIKRLFDRTWLSWMGKFGRDDVFHFRVHSPIIICEFDHECGMYLTNSVPGRFHVHTVIRTPNGNDYGKELLRLWRERRETPQEEQCQGRLGRESTEGHVLNTL